MRPSNGPDDEQIVSACIIASGPSTTDGDIEKARGSFEHVIVVNDMFRRAPWADVLYFRDFDWIYSTPRGLSKPNHELVREQFTGRIITGSEQAARTYGYEYIPTVTRGGLSTRCDLIHEGPTNAGNSGYQAMNLATAKFGARRLVLLGFDLGASGATHWHGDHPPELTNLTLSQYLPFVDGFRSMLPDLEAMRIEVVNCTRVSALPWFPRSVIEAEI